MILSREMSESLAIIGKRKFFMEVTGGLTSDEEGILGIHKLAF